MMVATIIEKAGHSASAFSLIYHSPVFIAVWAALAVLGTMEIVRNQLYKRPAVLCIHIAFLFILAGALTTHLFSEEERIHLRVGESTDQPFPITLTDFEVVRSAGGAIIDYVSSVEADGKRAEIAMNRILKKDGYRLFQDGYDEDEGGAYFYVTHDPLGTGITYTGYFLLFIALAMFFFDKKSRFREALNRCVGRGGAAILLVVGLFCSSFEGNTMPKALPKDVAEEFGRLYVNYNGRICQVQTMAYDYVRKVYGKTKVEGYTAEQVFTGWLLFYDNWKDVPVKCKRNERGGPVELEKQKIVMDIAAGRDLKIFPVCRSNDGWVWYASASKLPIDMDSGEWIFIRRVNALMGEFAFKCDWEGVQEIVAKIAKYQKKAILPSSSKTTAERMYNGIGRPMIPAMACLTLGVLLFVFLSVNIFNGKRLRIVCRLGALMILGYLTVVLSLRWFVSGHIPMTNGYEVMLVIAWFASLLMVGFGKKSLIMYCFGFILSGFAMLVSCLGQASPQIGTLMPVLSSPLLSIHVGCMMFSYTLLGLLALNGFFGLLQGHKPTADESMDRGIIILYPAVFFLLAGTFIGAIWANVSWGNYWAWDPKETWALITIMVYSALLHTRSLKRLNSPIVFNLFCVIAFICVLITYFGVNYYLGGAHSYA